MSARASRSRFQDGLLTLWNVIAAPRAAFAALQERPTWLAAFVVTALASALAAFAMLPANVHALESSLPAQLANSPGLTAEQKQQALALGPAVLHYSWPASALWGIIASAFTALVLLAASAATRGMLTFGRAFALAMNVAVVNFAVAQLVLALIVAARGPNAFAAPIDVYLALPSAAWLVPSAGSKVAAFLCGLNPFSIWSFALLGLGMQSLAAVRAGVAYGTAALITLGYCALFASIVK